MPSLALARNQRVWLDDAMHEVRGRVTADVIHLERVDNGTMRVVSHRELAEFICRKKAKLVPPIGEGREMRVIEANLEKDISVLVPKVRTELDRRREYLKAIEEGGVLMLTERSLSGVIRQVAEAIGDANPPERKLQWPSLRTIYRAIARLDDYEVTARRHGKRIADLKYHVVKEAPKPTRPLERVEIDHTKLDIMILDDATGALAGRPWLTLAVDVHTRMPVGFHISYSDPSFQSVMSCLKHTILPKTYVAERYPDIKHRWECYGVPETVVVDNGREFHSKDFELACLQLGIQVQHMPRKSPWMKGTVERFFGQLNQGLLHSQPGTTFSNIAARGDYDPQKNGVITFSLLVELFHQWIIDVYARSEHRGISDLPGERWRAAMAECPVRLQSKAEDLDIVLWQTEERPVPDAAPAAGRSQETGNPGRGRFA